MKFNKNSLCLLLSVLLSICPCSVLPDAIEIASSLALPAATAIATAVAIAPPVGPVITATLAFLTVCSNVFKMPPLEKPVEVQKQLSEVDLLKVQADIVKEVKAIGDHVTIESERVIRELTMTIETHEFFEKLRKTLNYLRRIYVDKLKVVIDRKVVGVQKSNTFQDMLNYDSFFRRELRSFMSDYVKSSSDGVASLKPVKLFFEHLLDHEKLLALTDDDCSSDSLHNRIFKSFLYILKVLSEAYTMSVSAHVIQYQDEIGSDKLQEAQATRENAQGLIGEFKSDISSLIEKTKWALAKAPRDIRNCGQFELEEGKTFEQLAFTHILPKISSFEYVDAFVYDCKAEDRFLNITEYDIGTCSAHDGLVPHGSEVSFATDSHFLSNGKWPFLFMNVVKADESEQLFGHNNYNTPKQVSADINTYKINTECRTTFCPASKKDFYAISTQRVSAKPGNVITGLRFQVRNRVVYIDIQQGKYSDMLTVDPDTVFWTETPESDQIVYLGAKLRKIELGDFVLPNNSILTSIQLKKSFFRNGLIKVIVWGSTPPDMSNSVNFLNSELELNELTLNGADDPSMVDANQKNIISKAPVAGKRYFVSFQPSGFEVDLGTHTIPYLDCREVVSNPPAPLNGVEFVHEAVKASGGFIGIKLRTPSLVDLIDSKQIVDVIDSSFELK